MDSKLLTRFLPIAVFAPLSYFGKQAIFSNLELTPAPQLLEASCPALPLPLAVAEASLFPNRLRYTGVRGIDDFTCIIVTFFQQLSTRAARPLLAGTLMPLLVASVFFMWAEAARRGAPRAVRLPTVFCVVYQVVTFALTMPVYWLLFTVSGAAGLHRRIPGAAPASGGGDDAHRPDGIITRRRAEAAAFGTLVGCALPTLAMFTLSSPYWTALWQPFPLLVEFARALYLLVRPSTSPTANAPPKASSLASANGHTTVRRAYQLLFFACAALYAFYIYPLLARLDVSVLRATFLPVVQRASAGSASLEDAAVDLIKRDFCFGGGATLLASLWWADGPAEVAASVAWLVGGSVLLGPGAAFVGMAMWREGKIERAVRAVKAGIEEKKID
ncbi:hypothetical protein CONPUDRAFT_108199 [Coniophora puteana RWD-64-598 SS2]|uniref:Uncharacterized protein n=1 Tax=Coniophora puteana (strain RWD-64-598) TaxID=741705 RepID=A0A5M3MI89_CONPW|nr:uncharacterized protein CONPUDRAFT_108199 [Coniophora puteana RWD-64-598 SS2]EIW78351.1 hypothetical protein CONPUDRAFT_108199 [Coniophora puteana RWD-64-598 SS2]